MAESVGAFSRVAAVDGAENYEKLIRRYGDLYEREGDVRSPFARDYTRILHSNAYRRLKHKTQVFFNAENDHICTRMEHVAHVDSAAYTIAGYLALNGELTRAIAIGHDLGHAPFGHHGEKVLGEISEKYIGEKFWHERNGLRLVDKLELLEDNLRKMRNLSLTYAVRDGIISHCGEIDQNGLRPRTQFIDLYDFSYAGQYQPCTWEGCVVKLSDKIAYLGRDIEDALSLGIIDGRSLNEIGRRSGDIPNTTVIMRDLIADVCRNSSPEEGITMSASAFGRLTEIKAFNYEYIYRSDRFRAFEKYSELIINTLFEGLYSLWRDGLDRGELERYSRAYPELASGFAKWLSCYCERETADGLCGRESRGRVYENEKIYGNLGDKKVYAQAIIDFISGMTDNFAVKLFEEQLKF